MNEIERWSIERLSRSLAQPHEARRGSLTHGERTVAEKNAPAAALARVLRYFGNWRKRHAPLIKAG